MNAPTRPPLDEAGPNSWEDHHVVDSETCATDGCTNPVGWVLTEIHDTYDSGYERPEWLETYVDPTGALYCHDCGRPDLEPECPPSS